MLFVSNGALLSVKVAFGVPLQSAFSNRENVTVPLTAHVERPRPTGRGLLLSERYNEIRASGLPVDVEARRRELPPLTVREHVEPRRTVSRPTAPPR